MSWEFGEIPGETAGSDDTETFDWINSLRQTPSQTEASYRIANACEAEETQDVPQEPSEAEKNGVCGFSNMSMPIPEGFAKGAVINESYALTEYPLTDNPDVKLNLFYRGHRMSAGASTSFDKLLKDGNVGDRISNPQAEPLNEVLDDKGNPANFRVMSAKIEELDGRKVLMVEGEYTKEGLRSRTYYVNAPDTVRPGSVVQEITYLAPNAEYDSHLLKVNRSIKALKWTDK